MEFDKVKVVETWKQIIDYYFSMKERLINDISSFDIQRFINSLRVVEKEHLHIVRGSDNYDLITNYLVVQYDYPDTYWNNIGYDVYLDSLFPKLREKLWEYWEKEDETTYTQLYLDNPDLVALKNSMERDCKDEAWDAYRYKYNREEHIEVMFAHVLKEIIVGGGHFFYSMDCGFREALSKLFNKININKSLDRLDDILNGMLNEPYKHSDYLFIPDIICYSPFPTCYVEVDDLPF